MDNSLEKKKRKSTKKKAAVTRGDVASTAATAKASAARVEIRPQRQRKKKAEVAVKSPLPLEPINWIKTPFFTFSAERQLQVVAILGRYPPEHKQSAIMPLLHLAQEQNDGWISYAAMEHIGSILEMPTIKVCEVANFYTMYNKRPIGRYLLQVCRTTPCWLCGSDEINRACQDELGISPGQTSSDGIFTMVEVECLGACVSGPVLQVNNDYHEKLDYPKTVALLKSLSQQAKGC